MNVNDWIKSNTIFYGVLGSRAYGLHNENSDYDYRGVCIAPKEYNFGLLNFEQQDSKDPDNTVFDIKKFFKLALECNPNIIEYLFLEDENVITTSDRWERIVEQRNIFMSKRAKHRYLGYAFSQLKRVKSHKHWLLHPIESKPTRAEFGLPDSTSLSKELIGSIDMVIKDTLKDNLEVILSDAADNIAKINIRNYVEFDLRELLDEAFADFVYPTTFNKLINKLDVMVALGENHFTEEIMAIYTKEKMHDSAMNNWKQYQNWLNTRNPARAELEAKFGFDTKHVGHVFRLLIQGEQILKEGTLNVRLKPDDKEFVLAIKNGKYNYDEVLLMAEQKMEGFEELYKTSKLPHSPDFNKANALLVETIEGFYYPKHRSIEIY
jgi:predicted nucleotidyltransferase